MTTTSSTEFDIQEKTDILIKSAFGFPSTNETKAWFLETAIPPNNYIVGEDILVESIPSNTDICFNTIVDASNIGLTSSDFSNYNTTNLTSASIVKDSTGVLIRFKKLILEEITGGGSQSWYKINSNINQDQLIPSGTNLLQNSLQFNTKQVGSDQPYLYSVFKTKDDNKLNFGSGGGNWFIDNKNGVLFFTDYPLVSSEINSTYPPAVTITTYIGKKGLSNFAGGGGGSASSADGNFNVTGDIIGSEDLELNAGIIIQDDFIIDSSATRVFPDARFEKLEVHDELTVYGDISVNNFNIVKNVTFSGDITSDTLNTANIIQFDQTGTTLDIDLSGDVYRNSISTFGDIDAGGNLSVSGDASLNGRVDICGNFYAQYPASSIPFNSIIGLSSGVDPDVDLSLNAGLSVGSDVSFNSGLTVGSDVSFNSGLTVGSDVSFNSGLTLEGNAILNSGLSVSGNVGIGTTSPGREFTLYDASYPSFQMINPTTGTGAGDGFQIQVIGNHAYIINKESGKLGFRTNDTERMAINSSGNVGIGTANPSNKLHIYATDNTSNLRINNATSTTGFVLEQSTNKFTFMRNTESNGGIIFHTGNSETMRINGSGYVGIGTSNPSYPLNIEKTVSASFSGGTQGVRWLDYTRGQFEHNSSKTLSTSMYATGSIVTSEHFAALSDRRIKKDIIELNDDTALEQIRLLKPATYKYKDFVNKGSEEIIGFIAQEVLEAIPQAVRILTGEIPNVLLMGSSSIDSSGNQIITIPEYDTSTLEQDASGNIFSKLKIIIDENNTDKELFVNILEVVSATELKVEILDSEITELPSEVFIYGQEVDNKHVLVKDRIFAVATSALQEVDRQLQAEKAKTATLETEIETLKTQNAAILSRLSALESA
jgi:hypothetical protein